MHLEVGHSQGHHNIGCRMGLGEHVLDFSTGLDVPLWHIVFLHGYDVAVTLFFRNLQPKALPHALHDRKGHLRIQALVHEVNHDVVPTADNGGGRLDTKHTYKYDEKGNIIEEKIYHSDGRFGNTYTYKYEYDKNNNWTQRIKYKNTIPRRITERIIEYYP